jgi:transcriptional regulator with XRE-family HTH domain
MAFITGEQIRAGRALLGWEQNELAERANVSLKTIKRMEATSGVVDARSDWSVKRALELAGIEFVGEHDWRERSDGVRFCKDPTSKIRRAIVSDMQIHLDVCLKMAVEKDQDLFERPISDVVQFVMKEMSEGITDKLQSILHKEA